MRTLSGKSGIVSQVRQASGRIPTPAAGLGLGIASLGWALENAAPMGGAAQLAGAALASLFLVCVAGKFLLHPPLVFTEMRHPVLGSILPTLAMGMMVVSKAVSLHAPAAGEHMWLAAVALHLFFLAGFAWCQCRAFSFSSMVPSWFVPPVGIVTAALTSPGGAFAPLADMLLLFGGTSFALLLPVMVYRLIFLAEITDAAKPTIAILAAPASLFLAGYLSVEQRPSLVLVAVLLGVAVLLTAVIYIALIRLLRLPFSPAYAAFTFPLVISATALFKAMHLFAANPATTGYAGVLRSMATAELAVAVLVVTYVTMLYVRAGGRALLRR
ncbi:conserved membrane hypothetical protein [uncultured delta proteobacterium]|uniref:C4-dicarboxylate transporter/malic acid transport protein n=1 Tax=uncultured delta proteobacterium TaxID=34034 RepID=A0A212JAX5_9DELT|nr:conserved membrane hypothetical protein [uncultured delta proteobacterium]